LRKIEGDIIAYFGTKAAMSLGTALLTGVILLLFGAKFIYISVLIIFLLNFIPIIGSIIAVIVVLLLYLLTFGVSANAIWLFLALMAVQVLFGSILEPKIAGKRLNMSPIVILVSLYLWGWIWGIVGMLLSVPLTILIMVAVKHFGARGAGEHQIAKSA
jgi:predicted PurR-regulated permease PerM